MNIADLHARGKAALARVPDRVLLAALLLLAVLTGLGTGILIGRDEAGGALVKTSLLGSDAPEPVVASRSGTKYYFPWCGSANRITTENQVWFANVEDAARAGYSPASGCGGL